MAGGIHCRNCGSYHHMDLFPHVYVDGCEQCGGKKKVEKKFEVNILCPDCNKPWKMDLTDYFNLPEDSIGRDIPITARCPDCKVTLIADYVRGVE